jgi:TM2 domain-containing membrane protein YozV
MNEGFYEALIQEVECGPYSLIDLKRMAGKMEIDELTPVRKVGAADWTIWGDVEKRYQLYFYQQQQAARAQIAQVVLPEKSDKSRGIYIILALLFGSMGFHNFYAARYGIGFAQFFLTIFLIVASMATGLVLLPAITALWAIFDALTVTEDGNSAEMC